MTKKLSVALVLFFSVTFIALCSPAFTARANSAQTYWHGQDSFGAYVTDENCPVVVDSEKLTLRTAQFPSNYYSTLEECESYEASVTAEYVFRNPADYDIEMTLVFPFGKLPDYMYGIYDYEADTYAYFDDTARYKITADGEELERNIRYTLDSWKFEPSTDIARLSSEKRAYSFITPETPVTEYTYQFYPESRGTSTSVAANFYGLGDSSKTLILLEQISIYKSGNKKAQFGTWLPSDNLLTVYVIGEPLQNMPEWKIYENAALKKEVAGSVELSAKLPPKTYTFNDLALTYFDVDGEVGEVDWYNAVLDNVVGESSIYDIVAWSSDGSLKNALDVSGKLMRWYEYGLSIPAGERVVNSVTAPLYPSINADWQPVICSYTYLLSPASAWADFGSFAVEIQTPFYVVESSLDFEKGDGVYTYSQQGLPNGELTFTLSTSESPKKIKQPIGKTIGYFFLFFGIPLIFALVAVGAVVLIVIIIVRAVRRKKRRNKLY